MDRSIERAKLRYQIRRWLAERRYGRQTPSGTFSTPGKVTGYTASERGITLTCQQGVLRLSVITPDMIQVRFQPSGKFPVPFSYAVAKVMWSDAPYTIGETDEAISLSAGEIICQVSRTDARLTFLNAARSVIAADAEPLAWREGEMTLTRTLPVEEACLGLASQPVGIDLRGTRYPIWNTDPVGTARKKLPSYFTIPFYLGVQGSFASGLFWDNPSRGYVDVGAAQRDQLVFASELGEFRYYQIVGRDADAVLARYTELTGRMPMPPLWALGFHLSRWSYTPADKVREIANELRRRNIPCDALYLDIDYMDGYRCFTWNPVDFPAPAVLIGELADQGFKTVAILDPGIKVDPTYSVYQSGLSENIYLKYPNGKPFIGPVWAADSVFPDFTSGKARIWWRAHFEAILKPGIAGVWNDMNEPVIFNRGSKTEMPDAVRHDFEGQGASHVEMHNVYGMLMARASREALEKARPDKRPFNIVRAAHAGAQRYASNWTGDNVSDWDHLKLAISMTVNSGLAGLAFTGPDVGGFFGDCEPELFTRFLQLAALMPFFRVHTSAGTRPQEPWAFGAETEQIAKRIIELRYELLPYLYSVFAECTQNGKPMIRPLLLADPADEALRGIEDAYMVGESILVAPVVEKGATKRDVRLPKGRWYDFFSGEGYEGGRTITIPASLETLPIFIRAGHVIPMWTVQQYVGEKPITELALNAYRGDGEITLYEDAGEGLDYQKGVYRWLYFTCKATSDGGLMLSWRQAGKFDPGYKRVRCRIYGVVSEPTEVLIDDRKAPLWYHENGVVEFTANRPFETAKIVGQSEPTSDLTLTRNPLKDG
ncbi:MAG TPA: glycoside hydrolase family 31 protein [Aggregatilineales bacterium]|nr:glycoside hydrolase family 31 protein [Anaerolineales bacterium]HRE48380.1 glycoside hydrolase family 31 protein [Aggregatilineales bacterium]